MGSCASRTPPSVLAVAPSATKNRQNPARNAAKLRTARARDARDGNGDIGPGMGQRPFRQRLARAFGRLAAFAHLIPQRIGNALLGQYRPKLTQATAETLARVGDYRDLRHLTGLRVLHLKPPTPRYPLGRLTAQLLRVDLAADQPAGQDTHLLVGVL